MLDPRQTQARFVGQTPDGRVRLDGVRCGFDEVGDFNDWLPRFREASVDPRAVREVYLTIEPFAPEWLAAHAFLAFEFAPGQGVRSADGAGDEGLVVSVEARVPRGEEYDLLAGMMRRYRIVYQVGIWSDAVQKSCRGMGHKLIRHRLVLSPAQKEKLLRNTIRTATADHGGQFYNTVTNSCLTSAIKEINSALPWRHRVWAWIAPGIPNLAAALPRTADIVLTARHALDGTPCILTQPELHRWPEQQARNNTLTKMAARLSVTRLWRPAVRLAGLAIGAALGGRTTARRVGFAVLGQIAGRVVADLTRSRALTRFEPSEAYLARLQGGFSVTW
jgi:hypothetical protein